ncbi:NfeD family protein [Jannaschia rubra]|uniref:NfeD-like C-terminal domain-containing protein n=1 Tax=Jannaschia rubra TaxID=282197 RepID=A0A0M6XR58_9RHOB|nr:hypothetical protein [Jannaschia rubra]CTQ33609.1 hypothetical protein JAN5088_02392 [Jannaschia rubra]SFG04851.1 hypothetical protein SAMN04488517_102438 [Jannaschia rubra]
MLSEWWAWALAAVVFGILEVVAPTHILLGFAVGAGLVSLGLAFGLLGALAATGSGAAWLLLVFAVLSLGAWLVLRRLFERPDETPRTFDRDIND